MCDHQHRASNGWTDVTNCEMSHSCFETESECATIDAHNSRLQEQAYAMAERQDYCLNCGQLLSRIGHDAAKLRIHESGLRYWEV